MKQWQIYQQDAASFFRRLGLDTEIEARVRGVRGRHDVDVKHKQFSDKETEAGGQLFASFRRDEVWVELATGPRNTDKRTRYSYRADNKLEQVEINRQFELTLHYVGDWHTHPVPIPEPSNLDLTNKRSCFRQSTHELKGFIMLIVGTADYPEGIHISLNNENSSEPFVLF